MPTIYLIRHGQASFGQENYDQLSDLGKAQAVHLGTQLKQRLTQAQREFDVVEIGSMHRHKQTAERCLKAMRRETDIRQTLVVNPNWNEYDHQNILAQLRPELATATSTNEFIGKQADPKKAIEQAFHDGVKRWMSGEYDDQYIETWGNFRNRVHTALNDLVERNKNAKNIAVFTSGGPISLLSQYLLGVSEDKLMQLNWTLVNCGITKLVATKSRVFLSTLNEHVHFDGEHRSFITYS